MTCSAGDRTRSSPERPSSSANSRKTSSPNAWKVRIAASLSPSGVLRSTRSCIVAAAFSVNVSARISCGFALPEAMRWTIRAVITWVFPVPAPATMRSGPSPCSAAARCSRVRPARMSGFSSASPNRSCSVTDCEPPGSRAERHWLDTHCRLRLGLDRRRTERERPPTGEEDGEAAARPGELGPGALAPVPADLVAERREQPPGRVHRCELALRRGDVADERSDRGLGREHHGRLALPRGGDVERGDEPAHRRFEVALDADELAGEIGALGGAQPMRGEKECRRVDVGVPMHDPKARELGAREARQRAEDPALLGPTEIRLEANEVVEARRRVVLAELHDGVRPPAGPRIGETERLQRAEPQRLGTAPGELLDRQTGLEPHRPFEVVELDLFG